MIARALPSLLSVIDRREKLVVGGPTVVVRCRKAVPVEGPLARYAFGFRIHLLEQGYAAASAEGQVRLMAHLSRWLAERDLDPGAFGTCEAERICDGDLLRRALL